MVVYCDYCKVNHCGQKAIILFPEDKAKYALFENGVLTSLLCETHKLMLERLNNEKWRINDVEFIELKEKEGVKK
jgi:hypothetical protein